MDFDSISHLSVAEVEPTFLVWNTDIPDFTEESDKSSSSRKVKGVQPPTEFSKDNCSKYFEAVFRGSTEDEYYNKVFTDFNPEMCKYDGCNEFFGNFNDLCEHIYEAHTGPRKQYYKYKAQSSDIPKENEHGQKEEIYYTDLLLSVVNGDYGRKKAPSKERTSSRPEIELQTNHFNKAFEIELKQESINQDNDCKDNLLQMSSDVKVSPSSYSKLQILSTKSLKAKPIIAQSQSKKTYKLSKSTKTEISCVINQQLTIEGTVKSFNTDNMKCETQVNGNTMTPKKPMNYIRETESPPDPDGSLEDELANENSQGDTYKAEMEENMHEESLLNGPQDPVSNHRVLNDSEHELEEEPMYYDAAFILEEGLKKKSASSGKPFCCPVPGCGKAYKNKNGIKYHAQYGHSKRQEFPCHCGKIYTTGHGLKAHQKNHESPAEKTKRTSYRRNVKEPSRNNLDDLSMARPTLCVYNMSTETRTGTEDRMPGEVIDFTSMDWGYNVDALEKQIFPIDPLVTPFDAFSNRVARGLDVMNTEAASQASSQTRKPRRKATQKSCFTSIQPSSFCYKSLRPENNDFFFY